MQLEGLLNDTSLSAWPIEFHQVNEFGSNNNNIHLWQNIFIDNWFWNEVHCHQFSQVFNPQHLMHTEYNYVCHILFAYNDKLDCMHAVNNCSSTSILIKGPPTRPANICCCCHNQPESRWSTNHSKSNNQNLMYAVYTCVCVCARGHVCKDI